MSIILRVFIFVSLAVYIAFMFTSADEDKEIADLQMSQECRGYWVLILDFHKEKKRFPENIEEFATFYKMDPDYLPFIYSKPQDPLKDEIVITWKKPSDLGNKISIKESGNILKEKIEE
jgi:hypothetical protein